MPEIQIRPALAEEIPLLAELDHTYASDYVWQMDLQQAEEGQPRVVGVNFRQVRLPRTVKVDTPRPRSALLETWMNRSGILVAVLKEQPVGYCGLMLDLSPQTVWMTDLAVMRPVRRQGIGSALVLAGLEWTRQHGCQRLVLQMQPKNYPAICLAEKLGFDFCGYIDRYFPNQDIALFFGRTAK